VSNRVAAIEGPCGVLQSEMAASWLESLGTVGAFVVALLLAWFALRDRREQQARLITAYSSGAAIVYPQAGTSIGTSEGDCQFEDVLAMDARGRPLGHGGSLTLAVPTTEFSWTLQNRSNEMISDVQPELVDQTGKLLYTMNTIPVAWPGWDKTQRIFTPRDKYRISGPLQVRITFRDAVGRTWTRTSGGSLHRVGHRRG
jgi:hypothetical protein